MKKNIKIIKIFLLALMLQCLQVSGQDKEILLNDISAGIESYAKKKITITLKLKHVDNIFNKIIFYDKKNIDIEFDISSKELMKKLKDELLNLHEGMDYRVSFTVIKLGNLGGIIADLEGFKPVIMDKLP